MSELILDVDEEIIEIAEREAAKRNTTVSKFFTDFLKVVVSDEPFANSDLPPMTRSLSGLLKGEDYDPDERIAYLEKKHS